jgi:hypothetical protein
MSVTFITNKDQIVRYDKQNLDEEQKKQARKNIGVSEDANYTVFNCILELLTHTVYDSDMSNSLKNLEDAIGSEGKPMYKWVVGVNGTGESNGVATMSQNSPARAMALAENTGVPLFYSQPFTLSQYSPVVIPEGAISVTVRCPGFRVGFNELKLVDSTWHRQFTSDSTPVANEATYTFKSAESSGLYIKLRHLTEDWTNLSDVPAYADITFNF